MFSPFLNVSAKGGIMSWTELCLHRWKAFIRHDNVKQGKSKVRHLIRLWRTQSLTEISRRVWETQVTLVFQRQWWNINLAFMRSHFRGRLKHQNYCRLTEKIGVREFKRNNCHSTRQFHANYRERTVLNRNRSVQICIWIIAQQKLHTLWKIKSRPATASALCGNDAYGENDSFRNRNSGFCGIL